MAVGCEREAAAVIRVWMFVVIVFWCFMRFYLIINKKINNNTELTFRFKEIQCFRGTYNNKYINFVQQTSGRGSQFNKNCESIWWIFKKKNIMRQRGSRFPYYLRPNRFAIFWKIRQKVYLLIVQFPLIN